MAASNPKPAEALAALLIGQSAGLDHWRGSRREGSPEIANPENADHIPRMTDYVTRDQMGDRMEAVEARLDGKIAQVSADVRVVGAKMDALVSQMSEFRAGLKSDMAEFRTEVRGEVKNTKWWILGSALSVAAIVVGLGAYVLTAAGNNMTSLQTGVAIGQAMNPPK